ncbi:MAG: hypothetical protein IPJ58_09325 [Ardenticatenia bacterium]|nr:hypothetical protein [Ardenticatenia bacterium]
MSRRTIRRLTGPACLLVVTALLIVAAPIRADENHWDLIRPAGNLPPGLRWAAQAHDPLLNRLIFFGGLDTSGSQAGDLYTLFLNTDTFSFLRPRGTLPAKRERAVMAYDTAGDRAVLFGGYNGSVYLDDTWFLELSDPFRGPEWKKLPFAASKPAPRLGASMVHLPAAAGAGRMILFGGWDGVNRSAYQDVWALSLGRGKEAWTKLSPAGTAPLARDAHIAVYDAERSRMLVYGGWSRQRTDVALDDLWELDLRPGQERWTKLNPPSPRPPAQVWMSGVLDNCPDARRLLMFGGWNGGSDNAFTWALALNGDPAWIRLDPSGAHPRPRDSHVAAFDGAKRRMVIFGGWENEGDLMRDTWQLGLAPCGAPSPTAAVSSTPAPTVSREPTKTATPQSGSPTREPTPTVDPRVSPTPDLVGTRVAQTLTAIAPRPSESPTPDLRTAVALTLTALAPSPTRSSTPDLMGTIVAGTRTALAPTTTLTPNLLLTRIAMTLTAVAATPVVAARVHLPLLSR